MNIENLAFETSRLKVVNWRNYEKDITRLSKSIQMVVTESVLKTLPPNWGVLDFDAQSKEWILARERESYCLAVLDKKASSLVGVMLIGKPDTGEECVELRLGYFVAEKYWGHGYASEVIGGLCQYIDNYEDVNSIIAGVDPENIASIKVLTKNGFQLDSEGEHQNIHFYKYEELKK